MKRLFFCLLFIHVLDFLHAHEFDYASSIEQYIIDIYEQFTTEMEVELDFEWFYEELLSLHKKPLEINHTSREELTRLVILSEVQIENILYYTYRFGKLKSIYELQLIDGLDMTDIRYMLPFVVVGNVKEQTAPIDFRNVVKYGKHELITRVDQVFETKEGYLNQANETPNYQGNNLYYYSKYRFRYGDRMKVNFTVEKDAGEVFFHHKHRGFDFNSGAFQVNNVGVIKTLIIGDYQANFAQGLVVRQAFGMGKTSMTTNIMVHNQGFKSYSSTNEFNFFRGAALSMHVKTIDVDLFCSYRNKDANIRDNKITGFYKTGYHRTVTELNKKKGINELVCGSHVKLKKHTFQLGFSSVYMGLSQPLLPVDYPYNLFYFRGKYQLAASLDYRFKLDRFYFFGETASTDKGALATLNGCFFFPVSRIKIALLQRHFSQRYNAVFASALAEGSTVQNEQGIYLGVEMNPIKKWFLTAYADSYYFPWLKYGIDAPGNGRDLLFQVKYTPSRKLEMFCRLKYKQNMRNERSSASTTNSVIPFNKTALRFHLTYNLGRMSFKNVIEGSWVNKSFCKPTHGFVILQDLSYQFSAFPLKIDLRYLLFDVSNYDNRIYTYEKDVLYAFSSPMFYGQGSRAYINLRYDLFSNLSCWLKFSQTIYADDREQIGSGNELIKGNRKTEMKCLFRLKF